MAPLSKRYYCDDTGCYYTSWDNWARWVVLAVVIILFILIFAFCSRRSARRRRQAGHPPYYGTGWTERHPAHGGSVYAHHPPPPPMYSADIPAGHQTFYGNQQNGIELQQPQQSYGAGRGEVQDFQPPVGPPPSKAHK